MRSHQPESLYQFACAVIAELQKAGHEAYLAGGCVRDLLMNRESEDYDIATSALPAEVENIFPRTAPIGAAFHVVLVISEHEESPYTIEVATFRRDIGIADGRHPQQVELATAQEDVKRRDFSINGMLYDPVEQKVLDWVGGQEDLQRQLIRSIGEPSERIQEDYLRMLRAVRFSARFGFRIEENLWHAIEFYAPRIQSISAERVFEELTKILTSPHAEQAFEKLADSGLLHPILPEALEMKGCEQPPEYHPEGDVWVHTMLLLKQLDNHPKEVAWAALLHDIAKPATFSHEPGDRIRFNRHAQLGADMADRILKRLKAPNEFRKNVCELVNDHLKFADVKKMRESTLKRFLRRPLFPWHLELHRIDCMASHQNLEMYEFCKEAKSRLKEEQLQPKALLRGQDLIEMGYKPGPVFKKILEDIETQQLEGQLRNKQEAKEYVARHYS